MLKSDVFHRTEVESPVISAASYNMWIGLVLCWGLFVNWGMVKSIPPTLLYGIPPLVLIIGYLASCLFGVYLFNSSKDPWISFLGYNFVVVPFGLILNIVISRYDPTLVLEAVQVTATVTVLMMILGVIFPQFFQQIHRALTVTLLVVIVVELIQWFVFKVSRTWTDWVVAVVFCGYIGYDWGRANRIPKTADNAVDSAAAIYMDIINLFLRVLRILGRRRH